MISKLLVFSVNFKVAVVSRKVSKELTHKTNKDMSQNYYTKLVMINNTAMNSGTNFSAKIAE